jgi:hypothetical protein
MGRHARPQAAERTSHRGSEAFELPSLVDTYMLSSVDKPDTTPLLNGIRQPGNLLVEVGESTFGVRVTDEGGITVQGLKRIIGKHHNEKFVPDGDPVEYLQDGVLTELTSEQGVDAFDIATSPGRVSFYPESTTDSQDVRITAPAGYFGQHQ